LISANEALGPLFLRAWRFYIIAAGHDVKDKRLVNQ